MSRMFRGATSLSLTMAASIAAAQFHLLVTEAPQGNNPPDKWSIVLRYDVVSTGGSATPGNGIDKSLLKDPAGLGVRANGEILVGNRHGNSQVGSISRFTYDAATDAYVPSGTVTGNGLFGVHEVTVSPISGELFAANVGGGVSRFLFPGDNPVPNGVLGSGSPRGIAISQDGKWAYVTFASSSVRRYDIANGAFTDFPISGASSLHFGCIRGDDLYFADIGAGKAFHMTLDSGGNIVSAVPVVTVSLAADVELSPDGLEMYVPSHGSGVVRRFLFNAGNWVAIGDIPTGQVTLGTALAVTRSHDLRCVHELASGDVRAIGQRRGHGPVQFK